MVDLIIDDISGCCGPSELDHSKKLVSEKGLLPTSGYSAIHPQSHEANSPGALRFEDFEWGGGINQDRKVRQLLRIMNRYHEYTAGHQARVAKLVLAITQEMRFIVERIKIITRAALLHDVGKIGVPLEILNKPESLTAQEYEKVQTHVKVGCDLLQRAGIDPRIIELVQQHHENLDGTGYPFGLTADGKKVAADIVSLADTYDAENSDRPYPRSEGKETVKDEAIRLRTRLHYPQVIDAFRAIYNRGEVAEIYSPSRVPLFLRREEFQRMRSIRLNHRPC